MKLTETKLQALREIKSDPPGYVWRPKTMQKLCELGLAKENGLSYGRMSYTITPAGLAALKEV